ncbi:hypothetical protein C2S52_005944 [Perilla frutescens var. hirtella]|nr:hypothetical protein C2S51_009814 [Perilla frutescens var. frutescens]KAH6786392.1 hypothetical protein C2S52_005944 [Perilla frutescens var. hirtella]
MGNCIRKGSSVEWGGDDWGSFGSGQEKTRNDEEELSGERSLLAAAGKEVKIKISKKELEKLLKEADVEGLPLQQVLAHLINAADGFEAHQLRSWRPALQSIPEME